MNQFLDWRGVCSAPSTVTSLLKLPLITFFFIFMVFNSIIYQDKLLSVYCNPITSQFAFSSTRFVISPRSPKLCLISAMQLEHGLCQSHKSFQVYPTRPKSIPACPRSTTHTNTIQVPLIDY